MPLRTDLFEAGTDGYVTYQIPGIAVTGRGTVLAYCEARKSGIGDWADIDIALHRSTDGGETWEPPQIIVDEGTSTVNNPMAIDDRETGAVHFLYQVDYTRCFYTRSDDDGETFAEPVDITHVFEKFRPQYDWNVIAAGPGHGIQLKNGRLLVPVWLSTGGKRHRPSCTSTIYSDDHGKTWHRGEIVTGNGDKTAAGHSIRNPSETVAVELSDGRVMLNIRNESPRHRRLIAYSDDGATGWSKPLFDDELFEPVCMASIIRLTCQDDGKNLILFANPDSRSRPKASGAERSRGNLTVRLSKALIEFYHAMHGGRPRENLTIRLSYDEGKSWPVSKVLEPEIAGYSDLTVGSDGTLFCFYERGGVHGDMFYTRYLTVARFDLAWTLGAPTQTR